MTDGFSKRRRPQNHARQSKPSFSNAQSRGPKKRPPVARTMGEILPDLLKRIGLTSGKNRKIQDLWREIAGDELSRTTRVIAHKGGTLIVEVQSATVLHELDVYHKATFLQLLRERFPGGLTHLRFKLKSTKSDPLADDRVGKPPTAVELYGLDEPGASSSPSSGSAAGADTSAPLDESLKPKQGTTRRARRRSRRGKGPSAGGGPWE